MRRSFFSKAIVAVGVMASAVALSSIAVFATDYNQYGSYNSVPSNGTITQTWNFTSDMPTGSNVSLKDADTVHGIAVVSASSSNLSTNKYLNFKSGGKIRVPVAANSNGTIAITFNNSNSKRSVTVNDDTERVLVCGDTKSANYSATETQTSNGYIELVAAGGDNQINQIVVTSVMNSEYSITDTDNNYLGNFTVSEIDGDNTKVNVSYDGYDYYIADQEVAMSDFNSDKEYDASNFNSIRQSKTYTVTAIGKSTATGTFTYSPSATVGYGNTVTINYTGAEDFTMEAQTVTIDATVAAASTLTEGSNVAYTYTADVTSAMHSTATFNVSGTIYDSATGNAITGLSITTTSGTKTNTGTSFSITGIEDSATVTFSATGYASKTVTYEATTDSAKVVLIPKTIDDGTNVANMAKLFKNPEDGTDYAETYFTGYNINGFTFYGSANGKTRAYYGDFNGYSGRFNFNTGDASTAYMTYTAPSDGIITIVGVNGNATATDRSLTVKDSDKKTVKTIKYTDNVLHSVSFAVSNGKTYTFAPATGGSNICEVKFEAATPSTTAIVADGSVYAVAYISEDELENNSLTLNYMGSAVAGPIEEVYQTVTVNGTDYTANDLFNADGYLYVCKIDGTVTDGSDEVSAVIKAITKSFS